MSTPAVTHLPVLVPPPAELIGEGGPDHPMRQMTREIAFEGGWSAGRAARVAELFDGLAPDWHTRNTPDRLNSLRDALDRGQVVGPRALELGSGTGFATPLLAEHFPLLVAMDLSREMLRHAPATAAPRVQADAVHLPLADASLDALIAVNMFVFPAEFNRVLRPGGALVWVSSLGDRTPIYLSADDVAAAMGPGWRGVASSCGQGTWCVLRS